MIQLHGEQTKFPKTLCIDAGSFNVLFKNDAFETEVKDRIITKSKPQCIELDLFDVPIKDNSLLIELNNSIHTKSNSKCKYGSGCKKTMVLSVKIKCPMSQDFIFECQST